MPIRTYTHTGTQAFNLRPGMPVKASLKKRGSCEWTEIEGVVRTVVKVSDLRIKITVEDRATGKLRLHSLSARHLVDLHKGFLAEYGIVLKVQETAEEFFAAPKGAAL